MEIGVTQTLKGLLKRSPDKLSEVSAAIKHYVSEYKRAMRTVDGKSAAHSFHAVVDGLVSETRKATGSNQPSCRRGCHFCCYIQVDVSPDEAELLFSYLKWKSLELDWDHLKRQAAAKNWGMLSFEDRRCVFLSENGECKVYEHRPMSCRKYFVSGEPQMCNSKKYPKGDVLVYSVNYAEVVASAVYSLRGAKTLANGLIEQRSKNEVST
ncbi:MAG: YkgJ family cysteine cluster protein [Anaerolineaceae bacterium]|nr:MAG: YkgJ family cysteine cluster protein [Anaerolineaceae bacterium]